MLEGGYVNLSQREVANVTQAEEPSRALRCVAGSRARAEIAVRLTPHFYNSFRASAKASEMQTVKAPKSILKQALKQAVGPTTAKSATANYEDADARHQRNLDLALHHARLIQAQKDAQAEIMQSIETLLDFPATADADPKYPSEEDAARFKALVVSFQPGDYDSLIEERTAADLCGYTLCPRPPKKQNSSGKVRILRSKGDFQVVPKEKVEIWCSKECARRALYIKVQLLEEPAWTRKAGVTPEISLLPEQTVTQTPQLPLRNKDTTPDLAVRIQESMDSLRLERGNRSDASTKNDLLIAQIMDKQLLKPPTAPQAADGLDSTAIEGYNPTNPIIKAVGASGEDEEDGDWEL